MKGEVQKAVFLKEHKISNDSPFVLIAGPCQIESKELALYVAEQLCKITQRLGIKLIFKSSFDKANRTSINGKRGIGLKKAIPIFEEIKEKFGCSILTDIHEAEQCAEFGESVDILQIPALLCRQTDLLIAAAKTGKVINVKKGQFIAPYDVINITEKIESVGNKNILLTERGVSFGYNNLVVDMKSLMIMSSSTGYPVIFDATHSVQEPGGLGKSSGGKREFIKGLARAAIAVRIAGIFMETHPDPENALSDGPCMIHLKKIEKLLKELMEFDTVAKKYPIVY